MILNKWSPQKFIGFFTHAMICHERGGVVYTTEATPDKHMDAITGKESQISSRLPTDSIQGYHGQYCVRRLRRPLTEVEKERLTAAVDARNGAEYDSLLFLSYWMSLTRWQHLVENDNRYFCSDYVTAILNDVDIQGVDTLIRHPLVKTPAMLGSKFRSVLGITNLGPVMSKLYGEEEMPVWV